MAKRLVKKVKRQAKERKFELPGFPELNEFLGACFDIPVEKDDELLRDLRVVVRTVGVKRLLVILRHLIIRLAQYDELYQLMIDDIETNIKQFDKMKSMTILSEDDQVRSVHKNMMTMASRLDEFVNQMEEVSGQRLRKTTKAMKRETVDQFSDRVINEAERKNERN